MTNRAHWLWMLCLPLLAHGEANAQRDFSRVIALRPDAASGQVDFEKCAACHGPEGAGTSDGAIPRIAGQHYRVLVRQIVDFRNGKRWDYRMEGVATSHEMIPDLQDVADVAWYVSTLDRAGSRGVGDGQYVEQGAALYAAKCASCHGASGEGDDHKGIPRIAGQHAGYLSRQIYDAVDNRRPALAQTHGKRFASFDFQQVLGLADFLSRIGWKGEPAGPGGQ